MRIRTIALALALAPTAACARHASHHPPADSGFAALQGRGAQAMGVDQYTSTHRFDTLPDGGRIELQRDADDPRGVDTIRAHLRAIADAFAAGDFRTPAFVHAGPVPGAETMAARRAHIRYTYRDLPRGGEIRIATADAEALAAVHQFMAFQRGNHRAGGEVHHQTAEGGKIRHGAAGRT